MYIKKSIPFLLFTFASVALMNESLAEEKKKGFYGYGGLSYNRFTDIEGTVDSTKVEIQSSAAGGSTIGLGYDFGNTWKTDFSWYRTYAYFDSVTLGSLNADLVGRYQLNAFVLGINKDLIDKNTSPKFTPYLGIGLGMGKVKSDEGMTVIVGSVSGTSGKIDGEYGFLYSLKGGVDYAVNDNNDIYGEVKWIGYSSDVKGEVASDAGGIIGVEIGYKWKF